MEKWRWVPDYEGLYLVSDRGRVFSTPKETTFGRVMKQKESKTGYMSVCLCKDGLNKYFRVHRLVAMAFLDRKRWQTEVNHKNGIRADNRVENLEWVTRSENELHAYRVLNKTERLLEGQAPTFQKGLDGRPSARNQERQPTKQGFGSIYGVSKTTIQQVRNRKIYTEVE